MRAISGPQKYLSSEVFFYNMKIRTYQEIRESFTVWIKDPMDEDGSEPLTKQGRTIVYIKQRDLLADVTFPTEPRVISLADYDHMDKDRCHDQPRTVNAKSLKNEFY